MKSYFYISLLLFVLAFASTLRAQPRECASQARLQVQQQLDPGLATQMQEAESQVQDWIMQHPLAMRGGGPVTIPVVFHVVYRLPNQIPSRARLLDQLRVLNEDYGATNPQFPMVPAAWTSVAANTGIQFCLAQQDPQGDTTGGITHTQTVTSSFSTNDAVKYTNQGGHDAWDPTRYLNIWVCHLGNGLLGYAQFPSGNPATDGVVLHHTVAGPNGDPNYPFNLGRTATHEVGHWLGLYHISDCNNNDLCGDTPGQSMPVYGCPTFPLMDACTINSPGIMFMNFIGLCDDSCMMFYTQDQSSRMQGFLNTARSSLITSTVCDSVTVGVPASQGLAVTVFPNPSHGRFELSFSAMGKAEVVVYDVLGKVVASQSLLADGAVLMAMELPERSGAGVYFVRVVADGAGVMRQVLVE